MKFSPSGRLLLTVGEAGVAGRSRRHFDRPTDVAVLPDGSFYVSDGYGNARIAKFSADGRFEFDWGSKGRSQGQFRTPHAIDLDRRGRVYVADRENSRVQVFSKSGRFLHQWSTLPIEKPFGLAVHGMRVTVTGDAAQNPPHLASIRIAQFSKRGKLLSALVTQSAPGPGAMTWPSLVTVAST